MAGAFSGHLVDSFNQSMASTSGNISFNPNMHGTQANQSFNLFTQSSMFSEAASEATMMKIAALQAKLNQKLGPEYISQRPGGGGQRLTYAEGWKIINLANEVFGFNGWSTNIISLTTDFIDQSEGGTKFNICVTAIVRVTLRDGVYHEDTGCGTVENIKSKAQGLDKCKKEAVTDAVKRALRNFGNLMGNCLYDKSYTQEVVKIKVPPAKFDKSQLHRRPEFEEGNSAGSSTSTSTTASTSYSTLSARLPQNQQQQPQTNQYQRAPPAPPQVKTEPQPQSGFGNRPSDPKGKAPIQPHMPPPNGPANVSRLPPPLEAKSDNRRVSFAKAPAPPPNGNSSVTLGTSSSDRDEFDSFHGFSDDDALFASVNLEDLGRPIGDDDLGRPIAEEADMGRPLDYDDDPPAQAAAPEPAHPVSRPQQGARPTKTRLEAIIAAQLEQKQHEEVGASSNNAVAGRFTIPPGGHSVNNRASFGTTVTNENRNPNTNQIHGGNNNSTKNIEGVKQSTAPSMGGFQFPPGMPNPLQSSNGPGIGMKRPVDMMSSSINRGSRPGMGLQQAQQNSSNGRQVLGRLDNGDGGDIKRMRR
ncbi:RAD52 DNA repair protein RADC [Coprinopsis cinerea okayama7|uniref:RAD52 DNA repair protein RADC n=1 Tax=Coprinopsis cinerea (strain Okayama-7 / 130 / ATCC MYA-4618 / FGSC 9003) TaxID=240176 RepID=A8NBZ1_COPC7|nr:RAD52 DNA repair protein RADC [Coprinopsis cinerea okayama7\|eukprot:XP_001832349.2 RAD52 DNA repair protein RADC [Coprinopsis cinerea okayama7\